MKIWFGNESNQNAITQSNIDNAKEMLRLYKIELKNKQDTLKFDLGRMKSAKDDFNKWCVDNGLSKYKV